MLDQTTLSLSLQGARGVAASDVVSQRRTRVLWTGLGFAALMLIGLSASALAPSASHASATSSSDAAAVAIVRSQDDAFIPSNPLSALSPGSNRRPATNLRPPARPKVAAKRVAPLMSISRPGVSMSGPAGESSDDFNAVLKRLASADELPELREQMRKLNVMMSTSFNRDDFALMRELRSRDPRTLSASLHRSMWEAVQDEHYEEAAKYKKQLSSLTQYLPEYQLAGTWEGSIVSTGQQHEEDKALWDNRVRISYDGDSLSALGSDGAVTFKADISASRGLEKPPTGDLAKAQAIMKAQEKAQALIDLTQALSSLSEEEKKRIEEAHSRLTFSEEEAPTAFEEVDRETFNGEGAYNGHSVPGKMFLMEDGVIGFLFLVPAEGGQELAAAGSVAERGGDEQQKGGKGAKKIWTIFKRTD